MVFYETEGDLVRRFVFICELQTVTKFWVALIEANAVFWNENRYLTNLFAANNHQNHISKRKN